MTDVLRPSRQPPLDSFVSTGTLPAREVVRDLVEQAHEAYRSEGGGRTSDVYPALQRVPRDLFGICVATVGGDTIGVGDAETGFAIMSVSKPFVFALVCELLGPEEASRRLGANATGLPFNSLAAVERGRRGRTNPMVNPGAIAATSLAPGRNAHERWRFLLDGLSRFAGRPLALDEEIYASASATNGRNRALAQLLESYGAIWSEPAEAVDLYTRQCSLEVTARDLAVMGATLADGGVNPLTGEHVVGAQICHHTLAAMITAGLYETSGDWLYHVGLPAKSGIGGGLVTVSPGKGGLGTFAPPLDVEGNSAKGQLVARHLSGALGMDLLTSRPVQARP